MIIRSDFRDYYDCVAKQGVERSIVYNREVISDSYRPSSYADGISFNNHANHSLILFCGKLYPLVYFWGADAQFSPREFHYETSSVDKYVKERVSNKELQFYQGKLKRLPVHSYRHRSTMYNRFWAGERVKHTAFLARTEKKDTGSTILKVMQARQDEGIPIVVYDAETIRTNCCLNDYQFYKVVDPYTAFQSIQQFLSNIARPEPYVPTISDIDMVEIKGFDVFSSFRKERS